MKATTLALGDLVAAVAGALAVVVGSTVVGVQLRTAWETNEMGGAAAWSLGVGLGVFAVVGISMFVRKALEFRLGTHRSARVLQPLLSALGVGMVAFVVFSVASVSGLTAPETLEFENVKIGVPQNQTLEVTNDGRNATRIESVTIESSIDNPFELTSDSCSATTLSPGQICEVTVQFLPRSDGTFASLLDVLEQGGNVPLEVQLSGQALVTP